MRIYGGLYSPEYLDAYSVTGVHGIITNPEGMAAYSGGRLSLRGLTQEVCSRTTLPVYITVHGPDADAICRKAEAVAVVNPDQVGVKVAATPAGFFATRRLSALGIPVVVTAVFSLNQALAAATAGAYGVCPFITKAEEAGLDPYRTLTDICNHFQRHSVKTEVIAASITTAAQVEEAARCGAGAVALRWPVLEQMMTHAMSDRVAALFKEQWSRIPGEDASYLTGASLPGERAE